MLVPGSNNLALALKLQGQQQIELYSDAGRTINSVGVYETQYAAPVRVRASVQAVQRNVYAQLGLEMQKNYVTLFVRQNAVDLDRDTSGDVFSYSGRLYQLLSNLPWYRQDGWVSVLCVDIGADPNDYRTVSSDPGETAISSVTLAGLDFSDDKMAIVDVPLWTVGDAMRTTIEFQKTGAGATESMTVSVASSGVAHGSATKVFSSGVCTDTAISLWPGLATYGVVDGGLRKQHGVRLAIASTSGLAGVTAVLRRGVA